VILSFSQNYTDFKSNQADLNHYLAFTGHPLFQELAPAAHLAVDKFFKDYKDYKGPAQTFLLSGLAARAKDARPSTTKRSTKPSFTFRAFHKALLLAVTDASDLPSGPRADKVKKPKNSVRNTLPHSSLI